MHYRCTPILWNFNQGVEAVRPVSPQVSTVALFLLDCSGLLPIPGHVIGVSRRRRQGSSVRCFGAKETQPVFQFTVDTCLCFKSDDINALHAEYFFMIFCCLQIFSNITFSTYYFRKNHQRVKQFITSAGGIGISLTYFQTVCMRTVNALV